MSPVAIALGLLCALASVPAIAAPSAPTKEFYAEVERAEQAVAAGELDRGGEAYEAAYERLAPEQRTTATGTDVVLESVRARRAAFARTLSSAAGLRAAQSLLERHTDALKIAAPKTSTVELERELAEIRTSLAEVAKKEAAAHPGPWYVMLNGMVAGPFAKDVIAESYLDGTIDDATLIHASEKDDWVPLAKSPIFPALDRWYLGRDTRWLGPMSRATVLAKVREVEATGFDPRRLSVRLEWAEKKKVPYDKVSSMLERPAPDPTIATPARVREHDRPPRESSEHEAREPDRDADAFDNGRALLTITPRIGLALPGSMTPNEISKTKLGVGFPLQIDAVFAPIQFLELGSYFHYSVRSIKERGEQDTKGQRTHLISGGLVLRAKIPTSQRSRLRLGLYFGYNYARQQFEGEISGNEVRGNIIGKGVNIGPSLEWSIDVARAIAVNFQVAAMSQVWGVADVGALGAFVEDGSKQSLAFPPLAFLAIGLDFYGGQRK